MGDMNPPQREAVRYTAGPLLVLAGAGSGKTRVIAHKIAHLVHHTGLPAERIAAVTFTNKAAREMRARVAKLLPGDSGRGLTVSTFHTLGLNILRAERKLLGMRSGFSIFDAQDGVQLLRELLRQQGDAAFDPQPVQWQISAWKSDLTDPGRALEMAGSDAGIQRAALLYADYERHLRAYNALDFDDLIARPVALFRDHPEVLGRWRERLAYLLVDEYQDTNGAQYALVRQLVGERGRLTVVGDDDQSIYAWRGARPENLRLLAEDYPALKVIRLEQNYRSTRRILKAANTLIAHNPHLFDKRLWCELGHGDPIRVLRCADEVDESRKVAAELFHHRMQRGTSFGDYAILYRGNYQARAFEAALREAQIPYFVSGGNSFFERAEVKDVIAYLRLLANPHDDGAFLRVINVPRRGIGPGTLEKLGRFAQQRGTSLLAACAALGLAEQLQGSLLQRLQRFAEWLQGHAARARSGDPVDLVKRLLDELDYAGWLRATARDPRHADARLDLVDELLDWVARAAGEAEGGTLADLVARLALQDVLERNEEEGRDDRVTLMTLHAAKGLEFPHVFMVGLEEGLLPHRASLEAGTVEEERRLAYVGITRAQQSLTLTLAAHRKRHREVIECTPSRFLDELPADELDWEGREEAAPEARRARGRAALAGLRTLLGQR